MILIIHPFDKTTTTLNRIVNYVAANFYDLTEHFNIYPNDRSRQLCLQKIQKYPKENFIIFLGHGRSDCLYGSKGKLYDSRTFASSDAIAESPEDYYYNEKFVDESNYCIFQGRKLFCLACNSSELGEKLIKCGAEAFIGFGALPTSKSEFKDKGIIASEKLISSMKGEINYIIKKSIVHALKYNYTFEKLKNIIEFITNQRIVFILSTKNRHRYVLAYQLYCLKRDMIVLGNKKAHLI